MPKTLPISKALAERLFMWSFAGAIFTFLALMAWKPKTFTCLLRHILKYRLEYTVPLFTHGYGLWMAYTRRHNLIGKIFFAACVLASGASFVYLAERPSYQTYFDVVMVPYAYIVISDLVSGRSRFLARFFKGKADPPG